MAKVRKFSTSGAKPAEKHAAPSTAVNIVPDIPKEAAEKAAADAPVTIRRKGPGNPRQRRYKQKTYSMTQEDINTIEALVTAIRQAGLYERSRSDIVRAGVNLLANLSLDEQVRAVQAVKDLKAN
jgi:Arc/MetJ-type ribon-helix-helix transcriptional regulator